MSLELTSVEASAIDSLWRAWKESTDTELEATFNSLDYTSFLNVIKHLRNMGLREDVQVPKLNIMIAGGLRFTLVGEGVISAYCKDNTLRGKPFHVILKERKLVAVGGASEVDLKEYGVRIKIRRELPLSMDDPRVIDALSRWSTLPKSFRYIQRFSFTSMQHKGIQFDASFVRQNAKDRRGQFIQATTFSGANITKQPIQYEMEVEALSGAELGSLRVGIVSVLRGIQRSYVIVRNSIKQKVVELMMAQTRATDKGFPGTQPVTLHRKHMTLDAEPDTPNIRTGDYNVTDKADGLRCLMVVARTGHIYLVDRNLNVYGTDRRLDEAITAEWSGCVLDGEWVTQDAEGKPMSRYYSFDIFNGKGGMDVTGRPFLVRAEAAVSRLAALTEAVAVLNSAMHTLAKIPAHNSLSIHIKKFETADDPKDPVGIFNKSAAILDRLKAHAPYHTDGLIFTPNAVPLPKNVNTWQAQFKWKPASQNSVDFLVTVEKWRGVDDKPTATELIERTTNASNQFVAYKTLRLFVGSAIDPAFVDPRDTVLGNKPYPPAMERARGEYRPVPFAPQPPDPMASLCYVAINPTDDNIYCEETKDPISNKTVVEMVYDPKRPAGWRWIPLRVRWDKTELYARKVVRGTLNSEMVANDVWLSIHEPVTEFMIRTGATTEETPDVAVGADALAVAYYQRRTNHRDLHKVRGLADFHNRYIKETLLLNSTLKAGDALIDMSVGQGGDLFKWIRNKVGWVLGCDIALSGLTDNKSGAYRRYLEQLVRTKGAVAPMIFIQADSSKRFKDGSAGMTPVDRAMLRTLWGENEPNSPPAAVKLRGAATHGFQVASLMFSIHYFFKDLSTLNGMLKNLADTVKVGGYFVGCCFDGDAVAALLRSLPLGGTKRGSEDGVDLWAITKQYDDEGTGILPPTHDGLGRAIDVNFISIGETYTEYLVSWAYLQSRLGDIGFDLLNAEECAGLGLQHSTNMFGESYEMAKKDGKNFPMNDIVSQFSFLNRWFIFRRHSTGSNLPDTAPGIEEIPIIPPPVLAPVPEEIDIDKVPEAEAAAEAAVEAVPEEIDIDKVPEAEAAKEEEIKAVPALILADGPAYQFYHKSAAKDDFKLKDKHWRRYISTFAPFRFRDMTNPAISYTSLEAALGSAKYQFATNRPELGPQIFAATGNIAQATEEKRLKLLGGVAGGAGARGLSEDQEAELVAEEGLAMRDAQKLAAFKKTGAKFNPEQWDAIKERVLVEYVRQRYEGNAHFREILNAVAAQKARLVYYVAGSANELSGTIKADGSIEGENLYGRALMRAVGMHY